MQTIGVLWQNIAIAVPVLPDSIPSTYSLEIHHLCAQMPNLVLEFLPTPPIRVAFVPHPPKFCGLTQIVVATYWAKFVAAANCVNMPHRCCLGLLRSPNPNSGHNPPNPACSHPIMAAKSRAQVSAHASCAKQASPPWHGYRRRAASPKMPFPFDHRHGGPRPRLGQMCSHRLDSGRLGRPPQCPNAVDRSH